MSWPIKKLGDIALLDDGNWIESKDQSQNGIRLVQTGNIGIGVFLDKAGKERFVSEETFGRLKCTEIMPGDILVSRLPDPVGRTCLVPNLNMKMITAVDCTIVRVKEGILPKYFLYYSTSKKYFDEVSRYLTGSSRQRISRSNLAKIEIPVPPLVIQQKIVGRLDAIRKAQELNDLQISKTQELFESLLKKKLEQQDNWPAKKINEIMIPTPSSTKLPKKEILAKGKFPVIDQSQNPIAGYSNNENDLYRGDIPVIVFGDHTLTIKYIDFPFVRGADGTQIIKPADEIDTKFLFYRLSVDPLDSHGYSRHFKYLKEKEIFIPPIEIQKKIVRKLDAVQEYKKSLLKQKFLLKELFDSVLHKSMNGEI